MEDSVFTKIINDELPSHKVYEDDKTIAIIPLHPIAKGHVLVIPKVQIDQFIDMSAEDYRALMDTVQAVGKNMKQVLGVSRIGLQIIGVDVPHVHVHVIAFDTIDEYRQIADESAEPDHKQLAKMAETLAMKSKLSP